MTIFGIAALLIAVASFSVLFVALLGGMESNATGIFIFSLLGILTTFIGVAILLNRKKAPSE